jgi:hypothetical protein
MQIFHDSHEKMSIKMQLPLVPLLAAPLVLAATTMVMAESQLLPDRDTCWERIYDDAHLKSHPRQQVVRTVTVST